MSRINEIKAYIRTQQAKVDMLGISDKWLLSAVIDDLKKDHRIDTSIDVKNKVTFKPLDKS